MGQTIADETYKRFTRMHGSLKNHIAKVELGETSFNLYIFVKIISCFEEHFLPLMTFPAHM